MKALVLGMTAVLVSGGAWAHDPPGAQGLAGGLAHPLLGADHLLAMVAVGLWSAIAGGRALWLWPASFVGVMVAGFALALAGVSLPLAEPAILASVVALGLLVAATARLPVGVGAIAAGAFGVMHGYAHGIEAPGGSIGLYALGFVLATATLHLIGLALGRSLLPPRRMLVLRAAGVMVAVAGVALA